MSGTSLLSEPAGLLSEPPGLPSEPVGPLAALLPAGVVVPPSEQATAASDIDSTMANASREGEVSARRRGLTPRQLS